MKPCFLDVFGACTLIGGQRDSFGESEKRQRLGFKKNQHCEYDSFLH
jgi:hypothetical protein